MTEKRDTPRAAPDSMVALIPVAWEASELDVLQEVHPQVWAENLTDGVDADALCLKPGSTFYIGDCPAPISVVVDEPIEELVGLAGASKHPFNPTEMLQLEEHRAIWRFTMSDISTAPLTRARAFARLIATVVEAGAPGVFLPFCVQLHSSELIRHIAVDLSQPPALINLFVNAWNDDEWMVSRGLTVFGLPELETPVTGGLNAAYFRLLDVAASMLTLQEPHPAGTRIQLGPHIYQVQPGPQGPSDPTVPICGAFGRHTLTESGD